MVKAFSLDVERRFLVWLDLPVKEFYSDINQFRKHRIGRKEA